ncbi:ATP-binding protein [Kitasatospora cathayae]|uniref:DNA topoisomerase (ATP-hydrolyzing) n=1 Tax=Kitasatospora cathayae TaxID=3004092 RepID=A0ABY7PVI9_9ACTN|nr:ATP-binding protein [Kitasatospora sp. HUAS 3-15]WBP84439.1 ATP-binding protein [Kitasatospora sp. HUAS 3-15]
MDGTARAAWTNTTHDWAATVDAEHLARIRADAEGFAPGGVEHLVLEVLAYAGDEAAARGAGRCVVTLHADGSVSVRDDGRGTDTRVDERGEVVKKPVMATKDLRFFDHPEAERLPDGHPRRGVSVVAALSSRLLHTNRRLNGAWTQRYEHGLPVTGLEPVEPDGTTGTCVTFRPDASLLPQSPVDPDRLAGWAAHWPALEVRVESSQREG